MPEGVMESKTTRLHHHNEHVDRASTSTELTSTIKNPFRHSGLVDPRANRDHVPSASDAVKRTIPWKLLYPPPTDGDSKAEKIYRTCGRSKDRPELNIHEVSDPRRRHQAGKRSEQGLDLRLTSFVVDDDYTSVPTRREIAITGLNDNVDEKFLRGLLKQGMEPEEIVVYRHPVTGDHLRMAMIDFKSREEADAFINKYDGKTMMGTAVRCFFDPLCYQLSRLYEKKTSQFPSMPRRYDSLRSTRTIHRLRELCRKLYERDGVDSNGTLLAQSDSTDLGNGPDMRSTDLHLSNGCRRDSAVDGAGKLTNGLRRNSAKLRGSPNSTSSSSNDSSSITFVGKEKKAAQPNRSQRQHSPKPVECIDLLQSPPCILLNSPTLPKASISEITTKNNGLLRSPLPPPGLINPPAPVGHRNQASSQTSSNLEQRLAMLFGGTKSEQKPRVNQPPPNPVIMRASNAAGSSYNHKTHHSNSSTTTNHRHELPQDPRWYNTSTRLERHNRKEGEQTRTTKRAASPYSSVTPVVTVSSDRSGSGTQAEKLTRYNDARCRVRSTIGMELRNLLKGDLLRLLGVKASSMLDERYREVEELRKKDRDKMREKVERQHQQPKERIALPNTSPVFELGDEVNFIFGWRLYKDRIASLPSFKKKPIDSRRGNRSPSLASEDGETNRRRKREQLNKAERDSQERSHSPSTEHGPYIRREGRRSEHSVDSAPSSQDASRVSSDAEEDEPKSREREREQSQSDTSPSERQDEKPAFYHPLGLADPRLERAKPSFLRRVEAEEGGERSEEEEEDEIGRISPLVKIPRLEQDCEPYVDRLPLKLFSEAGKEWQRRGEKEEAQIAEFIFDELTYEDCRYLKHAWGSLQRNPAELQERIGLPPGRRLLFIESGVPKKTPREMVSPLSEHRPAHGCPYGDSESVGLVPHLTGCARTEGYYRLSKQRKRMVRRHEEVDGRTLISNEDLTAIRQLQTAAKDERAIYRRLQTDLGPDSSLLKVNQLKYRKKMIKFARSRIHGWGLYALEDIQPEEMIIEYVGEKIRQTVADAREGKYERRGMGSSYMFRIDGDHVIDATMQGNFGRFINHSCSPNCIAKVVTMDGEKRIVIYSKRLISKGEEITYDYKFAREDEAEKIECLCGSRNCQKFLN